jgi:hypothetical protein
MATALHLDALALVSRLQLLEICRVAVQLAQHECPPPLPAGPGGAPRRYREVFDYRLRDPKWLHQANHLSHHTEAEGQGRTHPGRDAA